MATTLRRRPLVLAAFALLALATVGFQKAVPQPWSAAALPVGFVLAAVVFSLAAPPGK
ncbi:hypothetical protein [Streptomyces sp. NPDC002690]